MTKDLVELVERRYGLIESGRRKLDTLTREQMISILERLAAVVRRSITDSQSLLAINRDLSQLFEVYPCEQLTKPSQSNTED